MKKESCFRTIWLLDCIAEAIVVLRMECEREIAINTFMAIDLEDLHRFARGKRASTGETQILGAAVIGARLTPSGHSSARHSFINFSTINAINRREIRTH